ncbi:MAG: filamentous hemagglutinin N-terminal domain-containing protein [Nitrospirales bacterium]|nr:filamentous hemagglutinin N-terminal domain-containing protein [Nitrospira sp.]MDR4500815.1 filamentous hemagglutinin N-terminal domain-containing protein [Nitrospirales bacterium]
MDNTRSYLIVRSVLIKIHFFKFLCVGLLIVPAQLLNLSSVSRAQVTLDGTLGIGTPGQEVGPGNLPSGKSLANGATSTDHLITDSLGARVGDNLFHSFSNFSIGDGKSATFTGPDSIANVLSRVTGPNASIINGTLASTIDNANIFLLNPAGVIFGPNAKLDVKGAFYATTADFVQLNQDGVFYASLGEDSVLTSAEPEAFGFLGNTPPPLSPTSPASVFVEGLRVLNENSVTVIGRDAIAGTEVVDGIAINAGKLQNPNSHVHLVSIGASQSPNVAQVAVNIDTLAVRGLTSQDEVTQSQIQLGGISLSQEAQIDTSGVRGGGVVIRGGKLTLSESSILVNSTGIIDESIDESWTAVDIRTDSLIIKDGGSIEAEAFGSVDGGDIVLLVNESFQIREGGLVITSAVSGSGNAGEIKVHADEVVISGVLTGIASQSLSDGNGGDINITTSRLEMDTGILFSQTSGSGHAGNIEVTIQEGELPTTSTQGEISPSDLQITGNASITTQSEIGSTGDAGEIRLTVGKEVGKAGELTFEGGDVSIRGTIFSSIEGTGAGGKIQLKAGNLDLFGSSLIQVQNLNSSQVPGNITLILTGNLSVEESSTINTFARNSAPGANLNITAKEVNLTNSSVVSTTTLSDGPGGNLTIIAENLQVTDKGELTSEARLIPNEAIPSGNAGNINVELTGNLLVSKEGKIAVSTTTAGNGGNITISGSNLSLTGGASVTAESFSQSNDAGNAGDISLEGQNSIFIENSTVTTRAQNAVAGDIKLKSENLIQIIDSSIISEVPEGSGSAGRINIDPQFIIVKNSLIDSSANFGDGGDVTFEADAAILIDPFSKIDTSSRFGGSGRINIRAPIQNLSETIASLPEEVLKVAGLFAERCAAQKDGKFSSFTQGTRGGGLLGVSNYLSSPLSFSTSSSEASSATASVTGSKDALQEFTWKLFNPEKTEDIIEHCASIPLFRS